jgi:hypothetical protein
MHAALAHLIDALEQTPQTAIRSIEVMSEAELLLIGNQAIGLPVITATGKRQQPIPLSFHQERLWFIDTFEAGSLYESSPTYHNIPLLLQIDGQVEAPFIQEALNLIAVRHRPGLPIIND